MSDSINQFIQRFQLQLPPCAPVLKQSRKAAVLIPIICHQEPTLLLTRRSSHLRKHPGQIAFPGGAADIVDSSLAETALREAKEEVNLNPAAVSIIGQLPALDSISGFQVTPVIGLLPCELTFQANLDEVDTLFEIPLSYALNSKNYHSMEMIRHGHPRRIYFMFYAGHLIWGLTASILYRLTTQVNGMLYPDKP